MATEKERARAKKWYAANREKKIAAARTWQIANAERDAENKKAWALKNAAGVSQRHAKKYQINRENIIKRSTAWNNAHPERRAELRLNRPPLTDEQRAKQREQRRVNGRSRKRNLEKQRAQYHSWVKANPEKALAMYAKRNAKNRSRKAGAFGSHTNAEWEAVKKKFKYRCVDCGTKESDVSRLTRGHMVALAADETVGCDFAFNLRPQCRSCNSKQGKRVHNAVESFSLFDQLRVN